MNESVYSGTRRRWFQDWGLREDDLSTGVGVGRGSGIPRLAG